MNLDEFVLAVDLCDFELRAWGQHDLLLALVLRKILNAHPCLGCDHEQSPLRAAAEAVRDFEVGRAARHRPPCHLASQLVLCGQIQRHAPVELARGRRQLLQSGQEQPQVKEKLFHIIPVVGSEGCVQVFVQVVRGVHVYRRHLLQGQLAPCHNLCPGHRSLRGPPEFQSVASFGERHERLGHDACDVGEFVAAVVEAVFKPVEIHFVQLLGFRDEVSHLTCGHLQLQ
mmetsp:Transcript_78327/g.217554  ORF Transcript_78327/g.217554 Transcript_78327/m.217554 type:complete len:228 (-) Transcript_78327:291-974(-)